MPNMVSYRTLIALCCCLKGGLVFSFTLSDEQNVHTALLSGYNKDLRPGTDRGVSLAINASFYLFSIQEFDLNTGKLALTGVFFLNWIDERLSWNPASYNNTNITTIPQSKIWLPNFINVNPYEDITGLRSDDLSINIDSSGLCSWYAIQSFETVCDTDVTKYPFDTQTCTLKFYIWGYFPNEVIGKFILPKADLSLYSENGIWNVADSSTYTFMNIYNYEEYVVKLHLERRTSYYVVSLILPINAIALLMGFVFLLPPESGERVGFSTTVLLSIVVYLTIIQAILPESSEPNVSTLGFILVAYVVTGSIVVINVIISLRMLNSPCTKPVPQCMRRVVIFFRRKKRRKDMVEPLETKSELDYEDEEKEVEWAEVAKFHDMFSFIVINVIYCISGLTYFLVVLT